MRLRRLAALLLAALLGGLLTAAGARAADPGAQDRLQAGGATVKVPPATSRARRALRGRFGTQGLLAVDPGTGTPRTVARLDGFLTPNSGRPATAIALDYVRDHADVMGIDEDDLARLELARRYRAGGIEHLTWRQSYRGIPAIDSSLTAAVTSGGRLIGVGGAPRHALSVPSIRPDVGRARARAIAAGAFGGRAQRAALVIYEGPSAPRLGWRLLVLAGPGEILDVVVDGASGRVQRHQNLSDAANATVFRNYPGAPAGGTAETVDITPYLTGGATTLTGPNARAFRDVNDVVRRPGDAIPAGGEVPPSGGGNWSYPFTNVGGCPASPCVWNPSVANSWAANDEADATQIFWFVNTFHDHLENTPEIAFTNAAGNFEIADPVLAQSMDGANTAAGYPDGSHINNANMATFPEGTSPHMQMYLTNLNSHPASTGFDSTIVYHEYTHGLVGRSITDPTGVQAAGGAQGGAFNEGTSDWYALDYVVAQGLETDTAAADVSAGKFTFGPLLRSEPADCPVAPSAGCPGGSSTGAGGYTYGDFGKVDIGPEVHADGEIWTQTMWQLRRALIAKHGATTGVGHTRQLLTNGMRLAPDNPSFLDMRNAILQADTAAGLSDSAEIWDVFAARGMGYFASTEEAGDIAPVEDFSDVPAPGSPTGTVSGTVTEAGSGTPQSGVKVGFTGHDSGVGPELAATTNSSGAYTIANVPAGTYPLLRARGSATGFEDGRAADVSVAAGTTTRDFALRRNLAATASGATVQSFTGDDYSYLGCGPAAALDGTRAVIWSTTVAGGSKQMTVRLPAATTVSSVEIDPTAACGDDLSSSLKDFDVQVSQDNATFTTVASGSFTASNLNKSNPVTLSSTPAGTRYVRLIAKTPLSTSPGGSGATYVDVAELRVFGAAAAPAAPTAVTQAANGISATGATLNGSVNPNGTATSYQFEYGPTTSYGSVAPASPASAGSGTAAVPVSQPLIGLTAGTTYHYRVVAVRGGVRTNGADMTLTTTAPAAPVVTTAPATALGETGATLNGTINPNGTATDYQFEYGPTSGYGSVAPAPPAAAGAGTAAVPVSQAITGLAANTIYHFRLVGIRGTTRTNGADLTLTTTGGAGPAVSTEPASSVTATGATLAALINPRGAETTARFEYGETTAYGQQTADATAGNGTAAAPFSAAVSGLSPNTTYHYRVVASNPAGGPNHGADRTFTTGSSGGGGGGGGEPPTPTPTPTPDPTVAPTATPTPTPIVTPPAVLRLRGIAKPPGKRRPKVAMRCTVSVAGGTRCSIRYAAGAGRKLTARLVSGATVLARGSVRRARRGRLTLKSAAGALEAGRYRLTLRSGSGRKARKLTLAVTLR